MKHLPGLVVMLFALAILPMQAVQANSVSVRGNLFYVLKGTLYTWDGRNHQQLLAGYSPENPAGDLHTLQVSPDGRTLAFYRDTYDPTLRLMNLDTGDIAAPPIDIPDAIPDELDVYPSHSRAVFSPDGSQIAYWETSNYFFRIMVHDIASGDTRLLAQHTTDTPLEIGYRRGAHPGMPPLQWGAQISYVTLKAVDFSGTRTLHLFDPQTGDRSRYLFSQDSPDSRTVFDFSGWQRVNNEWGIVLQSASDDTTYFVNPLNNTWSLVESPVMRHYRAMNAPSGALQLDIHSNPPVIHRDEESYALPESVAANLETIALSPDGQQVAYFTRPNPIETANIVVWQPGDSGDSNEARPLFNLAEREPLPMFPVPEVAWSAVTRTFPADPVLTAMARPFVPGETGLSEPPVLFSGDVTLTPDDLLDVDTGAYRDTFEDDTADMWFRVTDSGRTLSTLPGTRPGWRGSMDNLPTPGTCRGVPAIYEYRVDLDLQRLAAGRVACLRTSEGNLGYFYIVSEIDNPDTVSEITVRVHIWDTAD